VPGRFGRRDVALAQRVQTLLIQVREDVVDPSPRLADAEAAVGIADPAPTPSSGREMPLGLLVLREGQGDLFQVVLALRPPCAFPGRLHCRQQEGDQDADDRDDHQQFNQGKNRVGDPWRHLEPVKRSP